MNQYLPTLEILFFVSTYILLVAYGSWQLFTQSDTIFATTKSTIDDVYFQFGWHRLFGRPQEIDPEWAVWTHTFRKHFPWFFCHALLNAADRFYLAHIRTANIVLGMIFVLCNYGASFGCGVGATAVIALCLVHYRQKTLLWLLFAVCFAALNLMRTLPVIGELVQQLDDDWVWELHVTLAWMLLRMLGSCLDLIAQRSTDTVQHTNSADQPTVWDALAYMLYVPTFFYGPIVIFSRYMQMAATRPQKTPLLAVRLPAFAGRLICMSVQVAAVELFGHMFYLNTLQSSPELCERLPLSALYTFGFMMGCVFFLKYRVAYGWSMALAQLDGMRTPPLPRFIGRVHLYSDMWKWFDHGLYEFLFRYVYGQVVQTAKASLRRRLCGAAVTFAFIYIFHGSYDYVLLWCVLNYACIVVEMSAKTLMWTQRQRIDAWMGAEWQSRWLAVLGGQLLIPAVLSNFFFFAGYEVGAIFVRRTYLESGWLDYVQLSGLAVCFWHTAEWLKRSA